VAIVNVFYTVKINIATKADVLITSLYLQIETPFQSRNSIIELAACKRTATSTDRGRHHRLSNIQDGGK